MLEVNFYFKTTLSLISTFIAVEMITLFYMLCKQGELHRTVKALWTLGFIWSLSSIIMTFALSD